MSVDIGELDLISERLQQADKIKHYKFINKITVFFKHYKCNIWPDPNLPGMASNHPEIPVRPARGLKSQRDKSQSNENDKNKVKIFDHKNLYFKF